MVDWCSLNEQDDYTALHLAVQYGKHLAAQALLGYGPDVNITGGAVRIDSTLQLHRYTILSTDEARGLINRVAPDNISGPGRNPA